MNEDRLTRLEIENELLRLEMDWQKTCQQLRVLDGAEDRLEQGAGVQFGCGGLVGSGIIITGLVFLIQFREKSVLPGVLFIGLGLFALIGAIAAGSGLRRRANEFREAKQEYLAKKEELERKLQDAKEST